MDERTANELAVVVPAFNAAATIGASLTSVLTQTVACREIVVVDDGSSDETRQIVLNCPTPVRLVSTQNQGAAAARNRGVAETSAPLIAFLDADDVWHPDKLSLQVSALNKNLPAVACSTRFFKIDDYDVQWRKLHDSEIRVASRELVDIFRRPYLGTPTVVVRRDAFNAVGGFDTSLRTAEDVDLWLRLAERGLIITIDAPLAGVRQLDSGISRSSGQEGDLNNLKVIDRFLSRNPDFAVHHRHLVARMRHDIRCRVGGGYIGSRRWNEAATILREAWIEYPLGARAAFLLLKSLLRLS
jgi:glycosyltransferase involved in cell wall biosynthesis